ncbi:MAG TPA: winged helix-turn-helix domain-containing protein [Amycolatopsis sp.]|uniref:winged helix-turn-helix domain-containing protein n=1 Tax=Amycolatopsis sp. TaxID=37632 RepID=UPI002B48D407|nr:winged helix-turn-helix domain-containing protein [Amycolatopsis sp.]HKS48078.1 winged helix-turn-helix domain-containing protein [Amycolatopsis sp.]
MDALTELRAVTDAVTYGELAVLRRRLWADEADAYRWFGQYLPTTLEQRREIEAEFESRVRQVIARGGPLTDWCARLRAEIAPVVPFAGLLTRHPALEYPVIVPNVAAWRVLARFGGVFEVAGDWAAVPDLASAVGTTRSAVGELAGQVPAEVLAAWGFALDDAELVSWLSYCGYRVSAGELHQPRRALHRVHDRVAPVKRGSRIPSATDSAVELLRQTGEPLHLDEILRRLPRRFSRGPLYNRLNADGRFVRVAPSTFALTGWDVEPYAGPSASSADNAARLIETGGRPLHLDEIRAGLDKPITREGLRNALNASDKLIRVAPSTYDLRKPVQRQ